jgi:hypothetical protein
MAAAIGISLVGVVAFGYVVGSMLLMVMHRLASTRLQLPRHSSRRSWT